MDKLITISSCAKILGVSSSTLRRWEREKKLLPERTRGGQRRYKLSKISPYSVRGAVKTKRKTLAYARVSSNDQKQDLERQKQMLEAYCTSNGWQYELLSDLGSGMNYHKKGLTVLINLLLNDQIDRLVITHKDRLLRFGAELIFAICEIKEVEVVIINKGSEAGFEEELAKDVLEIITVFSARLYGARSHKNKKLLEDLQKAANVSSTQNRVKTK